MSCVLTARKVPDQSCIERLLSLLLFFHVDFDVRNEKGKSKRDVDAVLVAGTSGTSSTR